jgi:hypothetical protein
MHRLGVRWTVGDVSARGFDALRLSIWGSFGAFGADAARTVVVNTISPEEARKRTGVVPDEIRWVAAGDPPAFLRPFLDGDMAEGVAWKLAPLRVYPDRYELALDNDCILWAPPDSLLRWLAEEAPRCLIAADEVPAHGAFAHLAGPQPRNTGIRGLPPFHDLGAALLAVLDKHPIPLRSELDEQGLQVVAFDLDAPALVVPTSEVGLCSPFWPHRPRLGSAGAHFIGLNARCLPFDYYGRPASEWVEENFDKHRRTLARLVGAPA